MTDFDRRDHHGTHEKLLTQIPDNGDAGRINAIIVPTARPTRYLRDGAKLAKELGCPLFALCSQDADAVSTVKLGEELGARVVALDFSPEMVRWSFQADKVLESRGLGRATDVSLKRNLGLVLAKAAGWGTVLFLDDDIAQLNPRDVQTAASHLDGFTAVGLRNVGFEDNSVVCHAYRAVGEKQATFIGGGALVVSPGRTRSFFPRTYCQDWLFYLGGGVPPQLGVTGQVSQKPYDPFVPRRARNEEFGDFLAEGLFRLLHNDTWENDHTSLEYWRVALEKRHRLIAYVKRQLKRQRDTTKDDAERRELSKKVDSMAAAESASAKITPRLCVDYVKAWQDDLMSWAVYLDGVSAGESLESALSALGVDNSELFST